MTKRKGTPARRERQKAALARMIAYRDSMQQFLDRNPKHETTAYTVSRTTKNIENARRNLGMDEESR